MLLYDQRKEVLATAQQLLKGGLVAATWGNVSARDPETDLIAITPSGMRYEILTAEDIAVVDLEGRLRDGKYQPSSETPMHTLIYRERPDVRAIVHTHSIFATVMATLKREIPPVIAELALGVGGNVPVADFAPPGTEELGRRALAGLGKGNAVLLQNHGVLTVGPNLERAFTIAAIVEDAAKIYVYSSLLGTPTLVPAEILADLFQAFQSYGQQKD
ncbi:MAG: L-fuculose-phosphate aldolase [Bacillota bacterium]|jgi:ribulose-5-phosphate 4-epimerase/fuculose-1-phosphate aldolase|nr:L-fuculose-phosphate aldolase [Bacillota bacterium]